MRILIILVLSILSSLAIHAQRACTSVTGSALPVLQIPSQNNNLLADQVVTIPVVVHVIYNLAAENISEEQIISQINSLNADFAKSNADFSKVPAVFAKLAANSKIQFALAKTNPMGQATSGIMRKKTTRLMWTDDNKIKYEANGGSTTWDAKSYLNIWVCNTVPGLTGYASFPGSALATDGIVVRYDAFGTQGRVLSPFNKGRTLTHEVGHWFGLKHLWGDQSCGDDGIDDTPKQRGGNSGDPIFPKLSPCSTSPYGEMFMNFMDFTNDASMGMFTEGQTNAMRVQFNTAGARNTLLKSKGLSASWNNAQLEILPVNTRNLVVYPNPVHNSNIKLMVNKEMGLNGKNFAIISASGQIVKTGHIQEREQEIDVQALSPGMYQIRLTDVESNIFTKFIKN